MNFVLIWQQWPRKGNATEWPINHFSSLNEIIKNQWMSKKKKDYQIRHFQSLNEIIENFGS